jgi:hypothetical protein
MRAFPARQIAVADLADLSRGLSDAEAEELKSLRKIYPDLPPDPDDPLLP